MSTYLLGLPGIDRYIAKNQLFNNELLLDMLTRQSSTLDQEGAMPTTTCKRRIRNTGPSHMELRTTNETSMVYPFETPSINSPDLS